MCMSEAPVHPGFAAGKNFRDHSFFHFTSYFTQKIKSTINQDVKLQLMNKHTPSGMDTSCT